MEPLSIAKTATGFHIQGYPDAVKVLGLANPKARRLADFSLHRHDLEFALDCLEKIRNPDDEPNVTSRALWQSAIVNYIKCFGASTSRSSLDAKVVYKKHPNAMEPHQFFDSLRNKNLVHDDNAYTQCLTGAVLNKAGMEFKIAKVVCLSVIGETLCRENYDNLRLLTTNAVEWVTGKFDELADSITHDLESMSYDELFAMEPITYTPAHKAEDVHKTRSR